MYYELMYIFYEQTVLLFPSYFSRKVLKIISLNGFRRYIFLLMSGCR
jgi:hypothetical protein